LVDFFDKPAPGPHQDEFPDLRRTLRQLEIHSTRCHIAVLTSLISVFSNGCKAA
jgi:hypothetical protein